MKKIIFVLLVTTIMFIVTGCPEIFLRTVYFIEIHNKTNDVIRFCVSFNYPDTAINQNKPRLIAIRPQDCSDFENKKKWEEVLVSPNDTMSIFFFSESVVNTHTWEEIRDSYLIVKRYDLSYYDLKYLKWKVTYPPTEEMKNMKMYPPYEQ